MSRAIWCETLAYADVATPDVMNRLAHYRLELKLAVTPGLFRAGDELLRVIDSCRERGVSLALWPMLDDDEGRWANAANLERYIAWLETILQFVVENQRAVNAVMFDLEPHFRDVERLVAIGHPRAFFQSVKASRTRMRVADGVLETAIRSLHERGIRVGTAVLPHVPWEDVGRPFFGRVFGVPQPDADFAVIEPMAYTSILEGWSRGILRRADCRSLLFEIGRAHRKAHGEAAALSLGAVGTGAFATEPVYRSVDELRDDVAIARASGIEHLTLFDLGGVLARAPAERWLDAFSETMPLSAAPPITNRSRAIVWALRGSPTMGRIARFTFARVMDHAMDR